MHHVLGRSLRVEQFLPSALSGPGLRGLGGVEVSTSPEPPARRPAPQPRASRLQPPPGSCGAWGARRAPCLLPPPIGSFSVAKKAEPPRTRPPHVPATESGTLGSVGASGASPGGAAWAGRGWVVLDLDDENRRKSLKWSACPVATTPQLREAFTYLLPPSFGPCGRSPGPVARR